MDQSPAAAAQLVDLKWILHKLKLISAVRTGDTETVVDLLDGGVPIDTKDDVGMSLLHWATWGGHVTTMRLLIRRGCDVDSVDGRGLTPLHWAASMGRTKAVRELIRHGASKSVVAGTCGTPLHLAAFRGHVATAVAMLEEGCPLDVGNSAGEIVLHAAAKGGNVELVKQLVDRGGDVNAEETNGCTPLHCAADCGRTEAVCELIKLGASKSVVAGTFGTPLHRAAIQGHVETAVAMLEEGCCHDEVAIDGATVLHFAAVGGNVELVKQLVDRGGDVNAVETNDCTPLHYAAEYGRTEAVCELIKLGASKSVVAGTFGTPLHRAALKGHMETAVAMLEEGCRHDEVAIDGATVLHFAAAGGNVVLVKELVDRGFNVNVVEANGCTPIHDAAAHGKTEAVCELMKFGATKSVVGGNCGTPLHQAALNGHVETAVAMLEQGCPLDVVTSDEATVLHFAAKGGNVELVKELVGRGCDVNAEETNGCTPLHDAAAHGRTEAVCELLKLGATKSVVAGGYGTPLHQATFYGHVEAVGALLEDELSEPDLPSHDATPSKVQVLDSDIIGARDSLGRTPVMWALRSGQVELLKLLISQGGAISDRDPHSLTAFEHSFVCGYANKLSQFHETSGIRSSGEGLRGALATSITQGLVDAHKVLCLCAISGDSIFLEDQFVELVTSDACAMPAAVKFAKDCFQKGRGIPFISQLYIADENALNPLQMALLSLKCYEMGFATGSVQRGTKDHTSFITKLLSHPVLKETVHENFPNGLSPLDLARQFELHHIAALIEGAGGRPGVWADIPRDVFLSYSSELFTIYPLLNKVCDTSQGGHEAVKKAVIKILGAQIVERSPPSMLAKEQDGLWHPNAIIVGADVGAERDDHAYKSLKECMCVDDVSDLVAKCNIEINAMLNHSEGGSIHFGIGSDGIVEEGLDLEKNEVIHMSRKKVGEVLRRFWHLVDSPFVQVEPVDLKNDKQELTGRWRFDIVVKLHPTVVQLARGKSGYYRHGVTNVRMTYNVFVDKIRAECARRRGPKEATEEDGRVSVWDTNAAATVGADVGAEQDNHEYMSLTECVDVSDLIVKCNVEINAMLNHSEGGSIHFGIGRNGIVEEGLDLEKNEVNCMLRTKVSDEVLRRFWHPVDSPFVQVEPVDLKNDKQELTGRWRFDIVVKPHPTVVQLARGKSGYYRHGLTNVDMTYDVFAEKIRAESGCRRGPKEKEAADENRRVSVWDAKAAATVGADVGAQQDGHEYMSLTKCVDVSDLIVKCNVEINAMLNHSEGGSIHFGIGRNGIVEEGLDLEKNEVICMSRKKVDDEVLRRFWHPVDSPFVQVEPVDLKNDKQELTGRWRFDIVVKPHPTVVQLARGMPGYYRHGATNVDMTYDVFAEKIRAESARLRGPIEGTDEDGRVSVWDANAAATVGADVGAETYDHEFKTLDSRDRPAINVASRVNYATCKRAINAMLHNPSGGTIHFGICVDGIVEDGLGLEQNHIIDGLRQNIDDILKNFYPPVEVFYAHVKPVKLLNDKQELTGQWRFDIVVKPHPKVVLLSLNQSAYYRGGPRNKEMVHHVLAERIRHELAGQLPHGY